jgi:RNA polymerase sigma-70 factor (ECF subfamily)
MGHLIKTGPGGAEADRARFATTRWSVVRAAGEPTGPGAREALATLCRLYWYPVYAYARRRGLDSEEAADLTQGFFARLIERKTVRGADPDRGKFRSYLLGAFKHFMAHEWARARAKKRGGGRRLVPLDPREAEERYGLEPAHELTAQRLFERQWALRLLELAMDDLREQYTCDGRRRYFDVFRPFIAGGRGNGYREACAELGLGEGAARVAVHRLRTRYRELLREHIRRTVETPEQVDEEIQHLFSAVGA